MSFQRIAAIGSMAAIGLAAWPTATDAQTVQREYRVYEGRTDPGIDARFETRRDTRFDPRYDPRFDARRDTRFDTRYDPRIERRYEPRYDVRRETRVDPRFQPRIYGEPVGTIYPVRADIRRLRAEAHRRFDGWHVSVEYRVRFRDTFPIGQYELLLSGFDRGRPVMDHMGRPIVVSVPLDRPTDTRRTRTYFEGRAAMIVPDGVAWSDNIRIHGEVVDRRSGMVVATDTSSLRIR